MNIVVLDGYTLNPGDLSWEPLTALGQCTVYDRTPPSETIARSQNAEIIITNKVIFDATIIQQLPKLRYIGVSATGYNVVDITAADKQGIVVTNVPAYSSNSVAQLTFALLLELTTQVGKHAETVRQGVWSKSQDFCYWLSPTVELYGLTMGIVGYGSIAKTVANIARAFGMRVLIHTRTPGEPTDDLFFVDRNTLFQESDVVSLHCPLTPDTAGLISATHLAMMKPTAFLLNTSRGPLIDEPALAAALNAGQIAGAGLDVLSEEPPAANNPLLTAKNCVITPHMGWATIAARQRLLSDVINNVKSFLAGECKNSVNNNLL